MIPWFIQTFCTWFTGFQPVSRLQDHIYSICLERMEDGNYESVKFGEASVIIYENNRSLIWVCQEHNMNIMWL